MIPRLVVTASDGSALVLGEDPGDPRHPFRLVFEHEAHGAPEPVRGALAAFWVKVHDRPHVVFAGDSLDEPDVERVLVEFPHHTQTCPVRATDRRGVWMTFPEPFGPFAPPPAAPTVPPESVVTATWLTRDGRVTASERTPPLRWGMPVPPKTAPPPPQWPDDPPPDSDPDGWTGYAPG